MNKLKYIIIFLLIMFLSGCQARVGEIEVLDDLKISDISGICLTINDTNKTSGNLVENDETIVINTLKKLNEDNLVKVSDINAFDYSLIIETFESDYELLFSLLEDNIYININGTWYENKYLSEINEVIKEASYIK